MFSADSKDKFIIACDDSIKVAQRKQKIADFLNAEARKNLVWKAKVICSLEAGRELYNTTWDLNKAGIGVEESICYMQSFARAMISLNDDQIITNEWHMYIPAVLQNSNPEKEFNANWRRYPIFANKDELTLSFAQDGIELQEETIEFYQRIESAGGFASLFPFHKVNEFKNNYLKDLESFSSLTRAADMRTAKIDIEGFITNICLGICNPVSYIDIPQKFTPLHYFCNGLQQKLQEQIPQINHT